MSATCYCQFYSIWLGLLALVLRFDQLVTFGHFLFGAFAFGNVLLICQGEQYEMLRYSRLSVDE